MLVLIAATNKNPSKLWTEAKVRSTIKFGQLNNARALAHLCALALCFELIINCWNCIQDVFIYIIHHLWWGLFSFGLSLSLPLARSTSSAFHLRAYAIARGIIIIRMTICFRSLDSMNVCVLYSFVEFLLFCVLCMFSVLFFNFK